MKRIFLIALSLAVFYTSNVVAAEKNQSISHHPFSAAKGKYDIGTTFFTWSPKENQTEKYVGQIWYPSIAEKCSVYASYLPETVYKTDLQQDSQIAAVRSVITDATVDSPILKKHVSYPVLFFSPGLGLYRQQNTFMFEYLASRGFIVVSVDHPGTSSFTEKADGSFVYVDSSVDHNNAQVRAITIEQRAEHLRTVLDTVLSLNDNPRSKLYKLIDTNKIGVFGHSRGGATALRACSIDKRFKAAANLDGGIGEGEITYNFSNQAVLMLMSPMDDLHAEGSVSEEEYKKYLEVMSNFMNSNESAPKYLIYYKGVKHMNFTDWPLLWPNTGEIGSSEPKEVLLSLSKMADDFFKSVFYERHFNIESNINQYPYAKLIDVYSPK